LNTRKKYSKEFKLDAVSLVVEQNYSQSEAAKNLGINPNLLGRWIRESQAVMWWMIEYCRCGIRTVGRAS
jgi:transposase-like protein